MNNNNPTPTFKDMAYTLWQGGIVPMEQIQARVNSLVGDIARATPKMAAAGIAFPMEYVSTAIEHARQAVASGDVYLLADNLFYEWKEIEAVYLELMGELG